ncbi:MAG: hypothetical protein ACKV2V_16605 [Blastocatellia bacterium]
MKVTAYLGGVLSLLIVACAQGSAQSGGLTAEMERARNKAEFARNFGALQNIAYAMLREHEQGQLSAAKLGKNTGDIHKKARTLRGMMQLGELKAPVVENATALDTPGKFDLAIRRLSRLVYNFAHNPVHQNRRVFNTDQAQKALVDLETIILLSKVINGQAKNYRSP